MPVVDARTCCTARRRPRAARHEREEEELGARVAQPRAARAGSRPGRRRTGCSRSRRSGCATSRTARCLANVAACEATNEQRADPGAGAERDASCRAALTRQRSPGPAPSLAFVIVTKTLSAVAPDQQEHRLAGRRRLCSSRCTWLTLATSCWFTSRMTSFGRMPALNAGLLRSTSMTTAPPRLRGQLELAGDLRRDRSDVHAEAGRGRLFHRVACGCSPARPCSASRSSSSTVTFSVFFAASCGRP